MDIDRMLLSQVGAGGLATAMFVAFAALTVVGITGPFALAARRVGLVDRPDARKRHLGSVPLVGGLTLVAVTCAVLAVPAVASNAGWPLALGISVAVVGLVDDRADISARLRFVLQLLACSALASLPGWRIDDLGNVLGIGGIGFGTGPAIVFTALCLAGVMNAVNMIDGIDGLSGGVCAITLLVLLGFTAYGDHLALAVVCAGLLGAVLGFLVCNLGAAGAPRRVFMGDAGTMLLGFLLGAVLVSLSQGSGAAFRPVAAGWLLALPIIDTVSVMFSRALRGRSPLKPGRDHSHHLLMDAGLGARTTLICLVLAHACLVSVGLAGELLGASEALMFWGFVVLNVLHFAALNSLAAGLRRGDLVGAARSPRVDREGPRPDRDVRKRSSGRHRRRHGSSSGEF